MQCQHLLIFLRIIAFFANSNELANEVTNEVVVSETLVLESGLVQTDYIGRSTETSKEFLGVPYAQQPVGLLRWKPPVSLSEEPGSHSTVRATRFGPVCVQEFSALEFGLAPNPDGSSQSMSEACLVLNIFAPLRSTNASKLPVLVFGHGGGDGSGASSAGWPVAFNGTNMFHATECISVVINYRLNDFGYLAHPAFASEDSNYPTGGNYGILDHAEALRWVQRHIESFGGDKNKVVFYGQSSGANHALWMLALPKVFTGLFRGVAIHSACVSPVLTSFPAGCCWQRGGKLGAAAYALALAGLLDCTADKLQTNDDAAIRNCLRSKTTDELSLGLEKIGLGVGLARPLIDGVLIKDLPYNLFASGVVMKDVAVMIGHNSGESSESKDSCLSNPSLNHTDVRAAFGRAVKDNWITPPAWLLDEAMQLYLPARSDRMDACIPKPLDINTNSDDRPHCCRVLEDFWQDMNLQCSEESTLRSMFLGARSAGQEPPRVFSWRFDQIQGCPTGSKACSHGMELGWLFGTPSNIFPPKPRCSYSEGEQAFSDNLIQRWAAFADTGSPRHDWPLWSEAGENATRRVNFQIGNVTVIDDFRSRTCAWWNVAYARLRSEHQQDNSLHMVV